MRKRWDSQYPSLWIADGGGGTFADIWTPDTFAQAGFMVSNTSTPGHVYELSNEHHVRNEIVFDHAANWWVNAPQTEEEAGESPESLSLEFDFSHNITIANYHGYRVTRSRAPFPAAVRLYQSTDIHFRNVHVNAESGYGICDENGCGTFLRAEQVSLRKRHRRRDPSPGGSRARVRGARHRRKTRRCRQRLMPALFLRRARRFESSRMVFSPFPAPLLTPKASSILSITTSSASTRGPSRRA